MERYEILEALNTIFNKIVESGNVRLVETSFADDIGEWESLNHIRFIVAIEKHFALRINTGDIVGLKSISSILNVIEAAMGPTAKK